MHLLGTAQDTPVLSGFGGLRASDQAYIVDWGIEPRERIPSPPNSLRLGEFGANSPPNFAEMAVASAIPLKN